MEGLLEPSAKPIFGQRPKIHAFGRTILSLLGSGRCRPACLGTVLLDRISHALHRIAETLAVQNDGRNAWLTLPNKRGDLPSATRLDRDGRKNAIAGGRPTIVIRVNDWDASSKLRWIGRKLYEFCRIVTAALPRARGATRRSLPCSPTAVSASRRRPCFHRKRCNGVP